MRRFGHLKEAEFIKSRATAHRKGYWEEDPDQTIEFRRGTSIDEVIDRMIVILQDAAYIERLFIIFVEL